MSAWTVYNFENIDKKTKKRKLDFLTVLKFKVAEHAVLSVMPHVWNPGQRYLAENPAAVPSICCAS